MRRGETDPTFGRECLKHQSPREREDSVVISVVYHRHSVLAFVAVTSVKQDTLRGSSQYQGIIPNPITQFSWMIYGSLTERQAGRGEVAS